jgi:hypothetical protein
MNETKWVNSGALFRRQKTKEKSPDMSGDILLSRDLLNSLPKDSDGDLTLSISAWKQSGPKGEFLSLKASAPWNGGANPQPKKEIVEDDIADPWA